MFTHSESVFGNMHVEEFIERQPKRSPLYQFMVEEADRRVIGLNNVPGSRYLEDRQRDLLFTMIYRMQKDQGYTPYTNELFHDAQAMRNKRAERLEEQKRKIKKLALEREEARQKAMIAYIRKVEGVCRDTLKADKAYTDEDDLVNDVRAKVHEDESELAKILVPMEGIPPRTLEFMLKNACKHKVRSVWAMYKLRKVRTDEIERTIKDTIRNIIGEMEAQNMELIVPNHDDVMKKILMKLPQEQRDAISTQGLKDLIDRIWQEQVKESQHASEPGSVRSRLSQKQVSEELEDIYNDDNDDDDFQFPPPPPAEAVVEDEPEPQTSDRVSLWPQVEDNSEMQWLFTGGVPGAPLYVGPPSGTWDYNPGGGLPYPVEPNPNFPSVEGAFRSNKDAGTPAGPSAGPQRPTYTVSNYYDWFYDKLDEKAEQWIANGTLSLKDAKELEKAIKHKTKIPSKIRLLAKSVIKELPEEAQHYFKANEDEVDKAVHNYILDRYGDMENLRKKVKQKVKCFPGEAKVVVKNRGVICMRDMKIGEHVLTLDRNDQACFEEVFAFSHADRSATAHFLVISTECGNRLRVSHDHLVPVGRRRNLRPASSVRVGDLLSGFPLSQTKSGFSDSVTASNLVVSAIEERPYVGVYCPHVASGRLLVDGVLVSCYTTVLPAWLSHSLLQPAWLLYRCLPTHCFQALFPYDRESGMPRLMLYLKGLVV